MRDHRRATPAMKTADVAELLEAIAGYLEKAEVWRDPARRAPEAVGYLRGVLEQHAADLRDGERDLLRPERLQRSLARGLAHLDAGAPVERLAGALAETGS